MSIPRTLRTIAAELRTEAEEPEINRDTLYVAVKRIEAQAEMLELGLEE